METPIFDIHVHIGVWQLPDLQSIGAMVEEYDRVRARWGIAGAALTTTDGPEDCILRNTSLLDQIKNRPEYRFFPWIRIQEPGILDFVRQNAEWIHGFKVHPAIDKVPFDDPAFGPLVELAEDLRAPILVHCGAWKAMTSYEKVLPSAQNHPNVDFILAHTTGGNFVERTEGVRHLAALNLDNVHVDITGSHRWKTLESAVKCLGSEKVLFGSDYGLGHPHEYKALIETLDLSDRERENIFYQNSLRILSKRLNDHPGNSQ